MLIRKIRNLLWYIVCTVFFKILLLYCSLLNWCYKNDAKSSSIIDRIFVSEPDKIQQSGVLPVGFNDHMIIFCTCKLCRLKIGEHKSVKMRSIKNYHKTVFNNSFSSVYWNIIYIYINEAWAKFTHIFVAILYSVALLKEIRIKQRLWIRV